MVPWPFAVASTPLIVDHGFVHDALPLAHHAVGRDLCARTHEHEIPLAECSERHLLGASVHESHCGVRERFTSSFNAPYACAIERISIQWLRSMIVTSVASSSQSGIPG